MTSKRFDVAIIGAGPAGSTAANLLARKGRSVALVERETFARPVPCAGWLNIRAQGLLDELGLSASAQAVTAFSDVTFYNADCTKSAKPTINGPVGFLIDRATFDQTLADSAIQRGATFMQSSEVKDLKLNESEVTLKIASGSEVKSRLLIVATGRSWELPSRVGFAQKIADPATWIAQVECPSAGRAGEPRVAVILGLDGRGSFGFCCIGPSRCTLSVNWVGDPAPALPSLARLCKIAAQKGVLPADLSAKAAAARLLRCPAGWALDMDTHVAKHTLLVGDAGGFVSAASHEGLYPAMWSAKIAAEVMDKALRSPYSQDELMSFDTQWRMQLADHLRSPHTDIRFLLPLIFSNQAMADRMAAAFFLGENI